MSPYIETYQEEVTSTAVVKSITTSVVQLYDSSTALNAGKK